MAKEEKGGEGREHKPKRMHLHEIRTTQAEDGSLVHHHTYKKNAKDEHPMPERGPMATSASPEEAGEHVAEQFGMNQQAQAQAPDAAGAGAPAEGQGAAPEEEG